MTMPGVKSGYRARLMRGIHAQGLKQRLDHDRLHDLVRENYQCASMSHMTDGQLLALYKLLAGGRELKKRGKLPNRGEVPGANAEIASAEDLVLLDHHFAKAGFTEEGKVAFLKRQLKGRDCVRTRGDVTRVMTAVRAINRRANAS